jgi:hypothetical protein
MSDRDIHDITLSCKEDPSIIDKITEQLQNNVPDHYRDIFEVMVLGGNELMLRFVDIDENVDNSIPLIRGLATTLKNLNPNDLIIKVALSGKKSVELAYFFISSDANDPRQPWQFAFDEKDDQERFQETAEIFINFMENPESVETE